MGAAFFEKDAIQEFRTARLDLLNALNWMLKTKDVNERYAGAASFLKAFSLVLGGYYLLLAAETSQDLERIELAHFYLYHLLPGVYAATKSACRGSQSIYKVKF